MRQADLARALGISAVRVSQIMNGRAPITPGIALRLARVLGQTPEYWLQLQTDRDLFHEREKLKNRLEELPRIVWKPLMTVSQ
jgi:addiction module HigA family antidote